MATIEFDPNTYSVASTNHFSGSPPARWSKALHHAGHEVADEQLALQLWKQQHKQGVFSAATKFGFTGITSRLQSQRRGHW
ncbi:MAG TPA: hypothetical protein VHL14_05385 [Steroidobacteraceae bacterium]|jgi:hypothetical protein|nr:hypothetical protein [Steroidobacteraceae bacterium]